MKKVLLGWLCGGAILWAQGCWDVKEESQLAFEELQEKITFSIKNAVDCSVVAGAQVNFNGVKLQTDARGEFSVPLEVLQEDMGIKVLIKKEGYISLLKKMRVEAGSIWENKILLSPVMPPKSARFVLSWGSKPLDLDIHLLSSRYHISYRDKKSVKDHAYLDRDGMKGFGPETITLQAFDPQETYHVWVHRYSKGDAIDSKAKIEVYIDNRYKDTIMLPNTNAPFVEVLRLNAQGLEVINTPQSKLR